MNDSETMPDQERTPKRTFEDVLASISELARVFLDERKTYGDLRTNIKKRSAMVRLFIVNELTHRLTNEDVIEQITKAKLNRKTLTLDSINALIGLELGEEWDRYEEAKFNSQTSEKAFAMFDSEMKGHQSKIKKDIIEKENVEYAHRATAQKGGMRSA